MAKACRQAFEATLSKSNKRRWADGRYTQDFIRKKWGDFQRGWKAMGEQSLEVYRVWAEGDSPTTLQAELEALMEDDDGK